MAEDFQKQMKTILNDFKKQNFGLTNEAIREETEEIRKLMQTNTINVDTGKFKQGWKRKDYPNSSWVYNGPLTNIVEFSARGPKPFIVALFRRNEPQIAKNLIKRIESKLRRK